MTISPPGATRSRPAMKHYGVTMSEEGMLAWDWVSQQMQQSRNYWLCTVRPDQRPHAVPVWGVWLADALYFGVDRRSVKARNLAHNSQAVIHLESGDETVIFEGKLQPATEAQVAQVGPVYAAKYNLPASETVDAPESLMLTLVPQVVMAWLESDFPRSATRWQFA